MYLLFVVVLLVFCQSLVLVLVLALFLVPGLLSFHDHRHDVLSPLHHSLSFANNVSPQQRVSLQVSHEFSYRLDPYSVLFLLEWRHKSFQPHLILSLGGCSSTISKQVQSKTAYFTTVCITFEQTLTQDVSSSTTAVKKMVLFHFINSTGHDKHTGT